MAQSSTCSFVLPLKFSHPNQGEGSVTQLQHPVKRIQNRIYRNSLKNPLRDRKAIIRCNFLDGEYLAEVPKDENVQGSIQKIDIWKQLNSLYKFSRPYVVVNTLVAIPSISLLPLESTADLHLSFFVGLFQALVPSVMMNLYAVGLNQLTDIDIDKVNKPYLALPSREISTELGIAGVFVFPSLVESFTMGIMFQSPPLLSALLVRFLMLTAYSVQLPLLRWKRNAFLAALCILIPRATDNVTTFIHIQKYALGRPVVFTRSLLFAAAFMSLFSTVIALSKDIEDVDGDRDHGIQSLAVIIGKEKVFWLCISMLLIGYGCAMAIGASSSFLTSKLVTVLGHCVLASTLWLRARSVDLEDNASISSFYMFIWKANVDALSNINLLPSRSPLRVDIPFRAGELVYAEYLLIPFIR